MLTASIVTVMEAHTRAFIAEADVTFIIKLTFKMYQRYLMVVEAGCSCHRL